MACMEHSCTNFKCGYVEFNNIPGAGPCPKCGSDMISTWDEQFDRHDDYDPRDYEDVDRDDSEDPEDFNEV